MTRNAFFYFSLDSIKHIVVVRPSCKVWPRMTSCKLKLFHSPRLIEKYSKTIFTESASRSMSFPSQPAVVRNVLGGCKFVSQDTYCFGINNFFFHVLFNRSGVAGAVLQSPPSIIKIINWLIEWLSNLLVQIYSNHCQSQIGGARELTFWEHVHCTLCVICHVSHVTCQFLCVNCHVSRVTCHTKNVLKNIGQRDWASWWSVCYQQGLPRLVL